jgi:hypothetical protein
MTIHKLIAVGVDMPERLLFMSSVDIGRLRGIDPLMRREIDAYIDRDLSGLEATRCGPLATALTAAASARR